MGWEALGQWGEDAARLEPLAGGVANDVWSVRVHGRRAVGRLGARSDADLAWETELLQHLERVDAYLIEHAQEFEDQLKDLLRIPSISAQPDHDADTRRAAEFLLDDLKSIGLKAELIETKRASSERAKKPSSTALRNAFEAQKPVASCMIRSSVIWSAAIILPLDDKPILCAGEF